MSKFLARCEQILSEAVSDVPGEIEVDSWKSHTDGTVTHYLSWCPKKKIFIDLAKKDGNVIERKEIDQADIDKYEKWYKPETLEIMKKVLE